MLCDILRERITRGEPLDADMLDHLRQCPTCGDEFAHLEALRSSRPQPSAALRERVLAAFPQKRSLVRWQVPAWVASVAAALVVGFFAGRPVGYEQGLSAPRPEQVKIVVEPQRVVAPPPLRATQLATLAIALMTIYRDNVQCEWKGHSCRMIRADKEILEQYPMCPLVQEVQRLRKEHPELVAIKE